jgi:Ni,Fe-hydrogenase III large subunit
VIFAEMERVANHCGDIGAMMLDTGFSFGGSNGARLRESVMQMNETLTGSRFLRGVVIPGGVTKDISETIQTELKDFLSNLRKDFAQVIEVSDNEPTLANRLVTTGRLSREVAEDYGALGIAARCVGIEKDVRVEYPYAAYDSFTVPIAIEQDGDVNARFHVRIREVFASIDLILEALDLIPDGEIMHSTNKIPDSGMAISVVEGWRGEIAYALVAEKGTLTRVKVRDTSFINWQLFPHIIHKDIVPDFPLINKSFNLSYTGNDL